MSKRIILNDLEVVTNEDVSSAQDLRQKDLNRVLEALGLGTFGAGSSISGVNSGGAIVSGLILGTSATTMQVTVGSGTAIFSIGGVDIVLENRMQLGSVETQTTINLSVSSVSGYRWDVIEVSSSQITTQETRQVLTTVGVSRNLVDTPVDKIIETQLRFRVRSGTVNATRVEAVCPLLQPDAAWLPIAAIEIVPSALTTSGARVVDLRKLLSRAVPTHISGQDSKYEGLQSVPSLSNLGTLIKVTSNWVSMGGYSSPIFSSPNQLVTDIPSIDPNVDKSSAFTLLHDAWYHVYAFRPTLNCGWTSLLISDVPPVVYTSSSETAGKPNGATRLPPPWDSSDTTAPSRYVGAVRLYNNGGTYYPRPFRTQGGYTAISGSSPSGFAGATSDNITGTGVIQVTPFSNVATLSPGDDATVLIPQSARMVKVLLTLSSSAGTVRFQVSSGTDSFYYYDQTVNTGSFDKISLDIPLPTDGSAFFTIDGTSVGAGAGLWTAKVLGYYEDLP